MFMLQHHENPMSRMLCIWRENVVAMNPNPIQFKDIGVVAKPRIKQLSKHSKKMYPEVAEQLNLLIKQAKLKELENKIGG